MKITMLYLFVLLFVKTELAIAQPEVAWIQSGVDGGRVDYQFGLFSALSISPDGKYYATATYRSELGEVASGLYLKTLSENSSSNKYVAFSPNEKFIAAISDSVDAEHNTHRRIDIWDYTTKIKSDSFVISKNEYLILSSMTVSQDGKYIVIGGGRPERKKSFIYVWNTVTREGEYVFESEVTTGYTIAISPDNRYIAAGGIGGGGVMFNLSEKKLLYEYYEGQGEAPVSFSQDGNNFITKDGTIYNVISRKPLHTLAYLPNIYERNNSQYSLDSRYLITTEVLYATVPTSQISFWDTKDYKLVKTISFPERIECLATSRDGMSGIVSTEKNQLYLWNYQTGEIRNTGGHEYPGMTEMKFSPDSKWLLTSPFAQSFGTIKIWDVASGSVVKIFPLDYETDPTGQAAFSSDRSIMALSRSGDIDIIETKNWTTRGKLDLNASNFYKLEMSPDGNRLLVSRSSAIELWDTQKGHILNISVEGSTFTQTGDSILGPTGIYNTSTGKQIKGFPSLPSSDPYWQFYSPDVRYALSRERRADDIDSIFIWDLTQEPAAIIRKSAIDHSYIIYGVSADMRRAYIGYFPDATHPSFTFGIWDVIAEKIIYRYNNKAGDKELGYPKQIAISPDNKHIAFGLQDGSIIMLNDMGLLTSIVEMPQLEAENAHYLQNYPNPAQEYTTIAYELKNPTYVRLIVTDLFGREITSITDQEQIAGKHSAYFSTAELTNGTYYCILKTDKQMISGKITVIR